MSKGMEKLPDFEGIRAAYTAEQVLAAFGIAVDENNKTLCIFHHETQPSLQVNRDYVYCFGCHKARDVFGLARFLLKKARNLTSPPSVDEVVEWFKITQFPPQTPRKYEGAHYSGDVPVPLIEYWHSQLTDEMYHQLEVERLLTKETVDKYKLGWRPDCSAWTIPFWRGELGKSGIDIVQFRLTQGPQKYKGLYGHNRGAIINAHLLDAPNDYLIVLFGAYDPILALQDGLPAVGTNGCFPFKSSDRQRIAALFDKQHTIFIVPDNTPQEYDSAYKLAEWLPNADVRFFPITLPDGCDYIDYRKLGGTPEDFRRDVLDIEPVVPADPQLVDDILTYLQYNDPYDFASVFAALSSKEWEATDLARSIAKHPHVRPFSATNWPDVRRRLWRVTDRKSLITTLDGLSAYARQLSGVW